MFFDQTKLILMNEIHIHIHSRFLDFCRKYNISYFKLESFLSVNGPVIESFHPIIISHG